MKEILNAILGTLIEISDSYYLLYFTGQWGLDGEDGEWLSFGSAVDLCARHAAVYPTVEESWDGWEGNAGWVFADDSSKTPGWAYSVSSFRVEVLGNACTIIFRDSKGEKGRLELSPGECRVAKALPGRTHGRMVQFLTGLRQSRILVDSSLLDHLEPRENPVAPWNPIYEVPMEPRIRGRGPSKTPSTRGRVYHDARKPLVVDGLPLEVQVTLRGRPYTTRRSEARRQRKARRASKALRLAQLLKANNKGSC